MLFNTKKQFLAIGIVLLIMTACASSPIVQKKNTVTVASTSSYATAVATEPLEDPTTLPTIQPTIVPTKKPVVVTYPTSKPVIYPTRPTIKPTAVIIKPTPIVKSTPVIKPTPITTPIVIPTPIIVPTPIIITPTTIPPVNNNPWGYDFIPGTVIYTVDPSFCSYFQCITTFDNGKGYVIECGDGKYSKSGGLKGSCSKHGGDLNVLYQH